MVILLVWGFFSKGRVLFRGCEDRIGVRFGGSFCRREGDFFFDSFKC